MTVKTKMATLILIPVLDRIWIFFHIIARSTRLSDQTVQAADILVLVVVLHELSTKIRQLHLLIINSNLTKVMPWQTIYFRHHARPLVLFITLLTSLIIPNLELSANTLQLSKEWLVHKLLKLQAKNGLHFDNIVHSATETANAQPYH